MVPIDSRHDRPWSSKCATLVLLDIRKKAELDLLRLDEHRSGGRLNADNGYSTYVDVTNDPDAMNRKYRPDPVLASFKHSGVDTDKLTAKRWAEFCAEPRDEEATIAALGLGVAENAIATQISEGEELEAQIAALGSKSAPKIPVVVPEPTVEDVQTQPEPPAMPEQKQVRRRRPNLSGAIR